MFNRKRFKKDPKNILVISDTQFPYEHEDALDFCLAVEKKYNCGKVIHIGDVADLHAFSQYEKSPEAESTIDELNKLRDVVEEWAKAFPEMDIMRGNHDERILRKLRGAGIPEMVISDDEILQRTLGYPQGWKWHKKMVVSSKNGDILFTHGDQKGYTQRAGGNSSKARMSIVTGHRHSSAYVHFVSTPRELQFDMIVGCLIDDDKFPFDYNNKDANRPILSVGVIRDGFPELIPMRLDKNGRWDGTV